MKKLQDFNEKYFVNLTDKIIAVDFDDTITEKRPYPEVAPLNPKAKRYLDKLHKAGFVIVLWTARVGTDYDEAYNRCINEFKLDYIQKDSHKFPHGKTGKIIARYYIDDRSSYGKVNWYRTYRYLMKTYCNHNS